MLSVSYNFATIFMFCNKIIVIANQLRLIKPLNDDSHILSALGLLKSYFYFNIWKYKHDVVNTEIKIKI